MESRGWSILPIASIGCVIFGSLRYFFLLGKSSDAERPETLIFHDRWLALAVLLWGAAMFSDLFPLL